MTPLSLPPSARQSSVLVVEDYADLRRMMVRMLSKAGIEKIDQAQDGYECLAMAQRHAYDVILLDISMPGITGLEVCEKLRQSGASRSSRIIACTAHLNMAHGALFDRAGFSDILTKPFGIPELLAKSFPVATTG